MLSQMAEFPSFLWLNSIPARMYVCLHAYTYLCIASSFFFFLKKFTFFYLFIYLFMTVESSFLCEGFL